MEPGLVLRGAVEAFFGRRRAKLTPGAAGDIVPLMFAQFGLSIADVNIMVPLSRRWRYGACELDAGRLVSYTPLSARDYRESIRRVANKSF